MRAANSACSRGSGRLRRGRSFAGFLDQVCQVQLRLRFLFKDFQLCWCGGGRLHRCRCGCLEDRW